MARPKKLAPTSTPIPAPIPEPILIIEPEVVEIAYSDIVTALLMRLHGETFETIAKYLKVEPSQIEKIEIFQTINSKLFEALLGELARQADYSETAIKRILNQTIVDALAFTRDSARSDGLGAMAKIMGDLINDQKKLQTELGNIDVGGRKYLDISKQIGNIGLSIAKLQRELMTFGDQRISDSIAENAVLKLLPKN